MFLVFFDLFLLAVTAVTHVEMAVSILVASLWLFLDKIPRMLNIAGGLFLYFSFDSNACCAYC